VTKDCDFIGDGGGYQIKGATDAAPSLLEKSKFLTFSDGKDCYQIRDFLCLGRVKTFSKFS